MVQKSKWKTRSNIWWLTQHILLIARPPFGKDPTFQNLCVSKWRAQGSRGRGCLLHRLLILFNLRLAHILLQKPVLSFLSVSVGLSFPSGIYSVALKNQLLLSIRCSCLKTLSSCYLFRDMWRCRKMDGCFVISVKKDIDEKCYTKVALLR